jgi:hypothetical protein
MGYNYLGYRKRIVKLSEDLKRLKKDVGGFPHDLEKKYNFVMQKERESKELEQLFSDIQLPYPDWGKLFMEFAKRLDPRILITRVNLSFDEEGKLIFTAFGEYTGTFPDTQLVLRKLRLSMEESEFFRDVDFRIERGVEVKIGEVRTFRFMISALVEERVLEKRTL